MSSLRPATSILLLLGALLFLGCLMLADIAERRSVQTARLRSVQRVVADLALSDLALTTEARYTRHPAVSDAVVVTMDHPGGLDHFPSTLFFTSVR
jgi:hypothetical protein